MTPGILDHLARTWSRKVGSEVKDIRYTYYVTIKILIFASLFAFFEIYVYLKFDLLFESIAGTISLVVIFLLAGIGFMLVINNYRKNLFLESEEELPPRKNKVFKMKRFYVTEQQKRRIIIILLIDTFAAIVEIACSFLLLSGLFIR